MMHFTKRTKIDSWSIVETEEWFELPKFSDERTNRLCFDQTNKNSSLLDEMR